MISIDNITQQSNACFYREKVKVQMQIDSAVETIPIDHG